MDRDLAVIANTTDLATFCAAQAEALDEVIAKCEVRPLSPQETRDVLLGVQELYVRLSQQQTFLAAMIFHRRAPWWVWLRAWLWGRRPTSGR